MKKWQQQSQALSPAASWLNVQPDVPADPTLPDKYESIVVPSDREALRQVNL